jgi:putative ABC transport system ATP-binding protein
MLSVQPFNFQHASIDGRTQAAVIQFPGFEAKSGELIWLSGQSGCGKTTLLNLIAGFLPLPAHAVFLNRVDLSLTASSPHAIGLIAQEPLLIDSLSAFQNAALPAQLAGIDSNAQVSHLFETLNITSVAHHRPAQLSRGQQQRVALARAFAFRPTLVLADEPTANLDDVHAHSVMTLIQQLLVEQGAAAVIASHDSRLKAYCSQQVVFRGV